MSMLASQPDIQGCLRNVLVQECDVLSRFQPSLESQEARRFRGMY